MSLNSRSNLLRPIRQLGSDRDESHKRCMHRAAKERLASSIESNSYDTGLSDITVLVNLIDPILTGVVA